MALLPSEVPTGTVHGQFYFVSEDSADANTDPDLTIVTGTVNFICSVPVLALPWYSASIIPVSFKAKFNASGQLVPLSGDGLGIELPATNSPDISPTGYTWKVEFDLRDSRTNYSIVIPSFNMQVSYGEVIDLTAVMPVSESEGVITVMGPAGPEGPMGPPGIADDVGVAAVISDPTTQTRAELESLFAPVELAAVMDGGTP